MSEPMTGPGVGRFFHHGWQVTSTDDPLVARMRTYHEFGHAALNAGTAWGGLLQQLDIVHRLTDWTAPGTLQAAVAAARHTHEAYATLVSISAMGPLAADAERLVTDQAGYVRFLDMARRVGPPPSDAARWTGVGADGLGDDGLGDVRRAALTACMQSPAVLRLLERGTENFRLADVTSRDWPDRRLRTLVDAATTLWPALTPPSGGEERFDLALGAASDALRAAGHPTLSTGEYQAVLPELVADLNRFSAAIGAPVEIDRDGRTGVAGLFGAETVRVRERLPARVDQLPRLSRDAASHDPASAGPVSAEGPVSSEGPASADLATTGAGPAHLFLTARRMGALRRQYRLSPDLALPDAAPVCAILTPQRRAGRVERLRLTLVLRSDQIARLPFPGPAVTCVSLDALRDDGWRERWLPALRAHTRVVGLLDLPPEAVIDAWLATAAGVRVTTMTTTSTGQLERAVVFRVGEEEPVVLLASPAAVNALVTYTERASGGAVRLEDRILDEQGESAVRIVLDHLVSEDALWAAGG